ncbi:hypothetical protein SLS56_000054 [Neofusicoccum ribis]|uniref:Uncharacterized protein n=1 Tax=Neofusicoccum ribis TaxID=45134 RepID=A0ABR3TFQ6_9PEZI
MRTSTIIAATVAYISVATAYPRVTRQSNVTEQWGYWTVSSPSSSHPPSGSHKSLDFLVKYESQAETAHCSASFPGTAIGIGPDQPYTACDDEAVSFTSDYNIGNVWLSQKLYQRGSVVILKGSAPLSLYGSNCTTNAVGGGTCFGPPFKVAVTSVSTQLPDNSTTIGSNSTAVDISALGEDDAAPEDATPDDYDTDSAEHGIPTKNIVLLRRKVHLKEMTSRTRTTLLIDMADTTKTALLSEVDIITETELLTVDIATEDTMLEASTPSRTEILGGFTGQSLQLSNKQKGREKDSL